MIWRPRSFAVMDDDSSWCKLRIILILTNYFKRSAVSEGRRHAYSLPGALPLLCIHSAPKDLAECCFSYPEWNQDCTLIFSLVDHFLWHSNIAISVLVLAFTSPVPMYSRIDRRTTQQQSINGGRAGEMVDIHPTPARALSTPRYSCQPSGLTSPLAMSRSSPPRIPGTAFIFGFRWGTTGFQTPALFHPWQLAFQVCPVLEVNNALCCCSPPFFLAQPNTN